jgi:hypothetical protein
MFTDLGARPTRNEPILNFMEHMWCILFTII